MVSNLQAVLELDRIGVQAVPGRFAVALHWI
jgi:hypothetical protein